MPILRDHNIWVPALALPLTSTSWNFSLLLVIIHGLETFDKYSSNYNKMRSKEYRYVIFLKLRTNLYAFF